MVYYSKISVLTAITVVCAAVSARGQGASGRLTGSFETNSVWYVPDRAAHGAVTPQDRFGSNNYLKIDYAHGAFIAGMQHEFYGPALAGFNPRLTGGDVVGKWAGWSDGGFAVTVGNFYEQFGAGLVLRSWEDRALGFNNSLEGVRVGFANETVAVKALWARPRLFMDYADTWIRGGDVSLSLDQLLGMTGHSLALEGSLVNRWMGGAGDGQSMNVFSGRVAFSSPGGFSLRGEWVGKGDETRMVNGEWKALPGSAQLVEVGFNRSGLAVFATMRRLDGMSTRIDAADGSEANTMNYLPALTRQYAYSLATLEPYTTASDGEQGGQIDIFYTIPRESALGGKYGTRLHANASIFYPLEKKGRTMNTLYRDVSFDMERRWNRALKTTLMYAVQTFSPSGGVSATTTVNNVFVVDGLYRFTPRRSLRLEIQYLYSKENSDWWAALAEVSFAPRWSFFAGDMYNHGRERMHYYSGGMSVTVRATRLAVSYGRNMAGYVCSGGVCRYMPAYTGANISITTSF